MDILVKPLSPKANVFLHIFIHIESIIDHENANFGSSNFLANIDDYNPTSLTNATRALKESGLDERRCWSERNPSDFLFSDFLIFLLLLLISTLYNPTQCSKRTSRDGGTLRREKKEKWR